MAALPDGGFLVTEYEGHRVRRVSAAGVITRVAGTGSAGFSGDGGAATAARLNKPVGVSTTSDGGFLIGDSLNGRVRKVSADGTIATVAGSSVRGYAGDGGPALLAQLRTPSAAAENASGAIVIADSEDNRLRLVEGRPSPDGPPPLAQVPPARPRAPAGVVRATAGTVYFPVACPPTAMDGCRGTIRLTVRSGARRRAAAARVVVIARGPFSMAAGDSKVVKVPLTRAGRRLLRKRRSAHGEGGRGEARRAEHRAVVRADHRQAEAQAQARPRGRGTRVNARTAFTLVTGAGLAAYGAHVAFGFGGQGSEGFFQDWLYNALVLVGRAVVPRPRRRLARRACALAVPRRRPPVPVRAASSTTRCTSRSSRTRPTPRSPTACTSPSIPRASPRSCSSRRAPRASCAPRLWLDGLVSALGVAALAAALLLQPIVSSTGGDPLQVATTLAYPLADVTLLAFVVGLLALNAWKPSRSWTLIAAGLATMAVADGIFLWQSANGTYAEGQALDALWPAAALLLGHAAWQPSAREATRLEGWRLLAMPALFALMPVGLLVYGNLQPMNTPALVLAAAALVVAVVRMAYTFSNTLRVTAEATAAALTDSLTGLRNRRALLAELEAELADAPATDSAVLVLFDLDGFKDYNDTFGHPAGDALLVRLGGRLDQAVAGCGSAYRLGGDEFCALLRFDPDRVGDDVDRAVAALHERGEGFEVASSHGTVILPAEAGDSARALQLADQRLYAQKGVRRRQATTRQVRDVLLQMVTERTPELRAPHRRRGPARPGRRPAPRAARP